MTNRSIRGRIQGPGELLEAGVTLRLFAKTVRQESALAVTRAEHDGRYVIEYALPQAIPATTCNLLVRAYDPQRREIGASSIQFGAADRLEVDFEVGTAGQASAAMSPMLRLQPVAASESESVTRALLAALEGLSASDLSDAQVDFAAAATGLSVTQVCQYREAVRAASHHPEAAVPVDIFYALAALKVALTSPFDEIRQALERGVEEKLLPALFVNQDTLNRLSRYRQARQIHLTSDDPAAAVLEPKSALDKVLPSSPTLAEAVKQLNLPVPAEVVEKWAQGGWRTLRDWRQSRSERELQSIGSDPSELDALTMLDRQSELSLLNSDIGQNAQLIALGFATHADIAAVPARRFAERVGSIMNQEGAFRIHAAAIAQRALIGHWITQLHLAGSQGRSNALMTQLAVAPGSVALDLGMQCDACESAISPAAYLNDLLNYAVAYLYDQAMQIDEQFFVDRFHQPFLDLPLDCDAVNLSVRLVRICVEVLRSYLGPRPLSRASAETGLSIAEATFRQTLYQSLLISLGTSYDEIGLARSASSASRTALAQRLAITLTTPRGSGDELDRLFLDPSGAPSAANAVTEAGLETLFGCADTNRDPLSSGPGANDEVTELVRWTLNGVDSGFNTAMDGSVYLSLSGDNQTLTLYRDAAMSMAIAGNDPSQGAAVPGNYEFVLVEQNESGLTGSVSFVLGDPPGAFSIRLQAVAAVVAWRLNALRKSWWQQDWQAGPYSAISSAPPPPSLAARLPATPPVYPAGRPTARAVVRSASGFALQINATALSLPYFLIATATTWLDTSKVQAVELAANTYDFEFASTYPADFTVTVTTQGNFDYPANCDGFISGRGTTTLTLQGLPVSLDASALTGIGVLIADVFSGPSYFKSSTLHLLPFSHYRLNQSGTGPCEFEFRLDADGTVAYAPALDLEEGGFLSGRGTAQLTVAGYGIELDARANGSAGVQLAQVGTLASNPDGTQTATLLPWSPYTIQGAAGLTSHSFALEPDGSIVIDPALADFLSVDQTSTGLPRLIVLPDSLSISIAPLPIVDPDLIGPDDFRLPAATGSVPSAFNLWLQRRALIDANLMALQSLREASGLDACLQSVLGNPLPDLDQLLASLNQGNSNDVALATAALAALGFAVDAFQRLMLVRAQDRTATLDPVSTPVSASQWSEVYSILAQAQKSALYSQWIAAETAAGVTLGYETFWLSLTEPNIGSWPPNATAPFIDPELIAMTALADPIAGSRARQLWQFRFAQLGTIRSTLQQLRESTGFEAMLQQALGDPNPGDALKYDIDTLQTELASTDPTVVATATATIVNDLYMSVASFQFMMTVRAADAQSNPQAKPSVAQWTQLYTILGTSQKLKRSYPSWIADEQTADGVLNYWDAFKANLPIWRARGADRMTWQQTLQNNCALPLIDPDLIGDGLIRQSEGPAITFWIDRLNWIDMQIAAMTTQRQADQPAQFIDAQIEAILGISPDAFVALSAAVGSGHDITARLAQLNLPSDAFQALANLRELTLALPGVPLVDADWTQVEAIFLQVVKRRSQYRQWRVQELQAGLSLSPDFFKQAGATDRASDPYASGALPMWRADPDDAANWIGHLLARMEQCTGVVVAWDTALDTLDQTCLPALRDALVQACNLGATGATAPADLLTARLAIDIGATGDVTTTRVEQAIETVQQTVTNARNGQAQDNIVFPYSELAYTSWGLNRRDVFALGDDLAIWQTTYEGDWSDWGSLGGKSGFSPTATSNQPGLIDVFAIGTDNALYQNHFELGWSGWQSLGTPPQGTIGAAPSATSRGPGLLDVFVTVTPGGAIYQKSSANGTWSDWATVPGNFLSAPAVCSSGVDNLELMGMGTDTNMYRSTWSNGTWSAYQQLGTTPTATLNAGNWILPRPSAVCLSPGDVALAYGVSVAFPGEPGIFWLTNYIYRNSTGAISNSIVTGLTPLFTALTLYSQAPGEYAAVQQFAGTMQPVIFNPALPTEPIGPLLLEVVDNNYEQRWPWLGTYANWRSAMGVFLYPENVLAPNLKQGVSSAFQTLLDQLDATPTLSASSALEIAAQYHQYYVDICQLNLQASCLGNTLMISGSNTVPTLTPLIYAFGRASSGNLYWTSYAPGNATIPQTPWTALPQLQDAKKIVSAAVYENPLYARRICLFVLSSDNQIDLLHYDLDRQAWDAQASALSMPDDDTIVDAIANQSLLTVTVPSVAMLGSHGVYLRRLSPPGLDWDTVSGTSVEEWDNFLIKSSNGAALGVAALVMMGSSLADRSTGLIYLATSGDTTVTTVNIDGYSAATVMPAGLTSDFLAGFPLASTTGLDVFMGIYEVNEVVQFNWFGFSVAWLGALVASADWQAILSKARFTVPVQCLGVDPAKPARYLGVQTPGTGNSSTASILSFDFNPTATGSEYIIPGSLQSTVITPIDGNTGLLALEPQSIDRIGLAGASEAAWNANQKLAPVLFECVEEAYYLVPMQIALQLQMSGQYEAALDWFRLVYDYTAPLANRKIYYGLVAEQSLSNTISRSTDWLLDPLDPHRIAATRQNAYTRYTICAIVQCLLDYADAQFSSETSEAIAQARGLYVIAEGLLQAPELAASALPPNITLAASPVQSANAAAAIAGAPGRSSKSAEAPTGSIGPTAPARSASVRSAQRQGVTSMRLGALRARAHAQRRHLEHQLLGAHALAASLEVADTLGSGFVPEAALSFCLATNPLPQQLQYRASLNLYKIRSSRNIGGQQRSLAPYSAAIGATANLPAIGANGQISLPAVSSPAPTPYRYSALIARASQLAQLAIQMESEMLSAYEKADAEAYNLLLANQQLDVAAANTQLSAEQTNEAQDGVTLATQQRNIALFQSGYYGALLSQGLSSSEQSALDLLAKSAKESGTASRYEGYSAAASGISAAGSALTGAATGAAVGSVAGPIGTVVGAALGALAGLFSGIGSSMGSIGAAYSSAAAADSTSANYNSTLATYERRAQDWRFQQGLAQQNVQIGTTQITIAQDNVQVSTQEYAITVLQEQNARDAINFLANKFTNQALYAWMGGVLQGIYSYFLQQAAATAKLAQTQLAFERQVNAPAYIQSDYWAAPLTNTGGTASDRRGLTGGERLLQDITQLDQYADQTEQVKLQLTKTISLALTAPIEFAQFQQTGSLAFSTMQSTFDRDFPGHYLRMIKQVRTTVVALVPPNQGICASLASDSISRVVVENGNTFQTVTIRRDPQYVALSSPTNSTGLFDLQSQSDLLLPFEDNGVDSMWQFRMEPAANPFDFGSIYDILISIDYTALNSNDYRAGVIRQLDRSFASDRPYSIRNQFPDQWYALNNPDQSNTPMTVQLPVAASDFPGNVSNLAITQVVLYFSRTNASFEVPISALQLTAIGTPGPVGGAATSIDGAISTRRGNAGSWQQMIGRAPVGTWTLILPDTTEMRDFFTSGAIADILLVISFSGITPPWLP